MNTSAVSPGRAGLLLLLSGQMLPLIDTSITNVALDAITHTLAASAHAAGAYRRAVRRRLCRLPGDGQ
ncbi:MFS transporter [Klebsiella pneumoniae]|uniref:MFS transporter n=1 Tax=Klebsiella pneumoniae TaxID=573 RepID=A0A377ZEU7_KLEPN|nr:MFS transporter [Klebsiella pneumoniae]